MTWRRCGGASWSATRWRRTPTGWRGRPSATSGCAATSPLGRPGAALRRRRRAAVRGRRLQDQPARRPDPAHHRRRLRPGRACRGDAAHSHYPLQATLYSVVLHRYLRWRLPGYDPARHLGGVLYLYLRGTCGPESPVVDGHPSGVFSWSPPARFVAAVSDLLAGQRSQPEAVGRMTELFEPEDGCDRRLALGATGLLAAWNAAGVLEAGDVHVATRVGELVGEADEAVRLAVASRSARCGTGRCASTWRRSASSRPRRRPASPCRSRGRGWPR
ncbi:MAG: hypothetical protein R2731_10090 [Nocardioides sp.]